MFLFAVPADSVLALPAVRTQPAAHEGTRKKGPTLEQAQAMSGFDGISDYDFKLKLKLCDYHIPFR